MRILLRAPIGSTGGYQRDGLGIINALEARDHVVDLVPLSVWPPVPKNVAHLLTFPVATSGYDLEIHHVPPIALEIGEPSRKRSKKTVLWSMWEWDNYSEEELEYNGTQYYMPKYDHVVGYTQQTLDAFKSAGFIRDDQPTSVVQGGFEAKDWYPVSDASERFQQVFPDRSKLRDNTFRFAMVGHLNMRKNPYEVLYAFNELKEELGDDFDAELIIKSGYPVVPPQYDAPGVKVIMENQWTDAQMREFYWSIDCVVNCAWGEGKDLPLMEATMCGVPIIANDNPGHQGWIHPEITKMVPSTPKKMDANHIGRYTGRDEIKKAMLDTYHNKMAKYREAHRLADYIAQRATWDYRIVKFGEAIGVPL